MKKLVVAPISNTIYWATVNEKQGTMNTQTRVDVTEGAVDAVFQHFINMKEYDENGFFGYEIPKKNNEEIAIFCVYKNDEHITISKKLYQQLLEYKYMYDALDK